MKKQIKRYIASLWGVLLGVAAIGAGAADSVPVPTAAHLRWHQYEQTMFIHFAPTTWQPGREYDNHTTDLGRMTLENMDTDQWCEVAKSWGARQIMFVAKHTGGFCWWPTSTTDYSVKSIPWKDGKGDLLRDISESCRKYGLDLGIYVYSGDEQWGAGIGSGGVTKDPSKQQAYNEVYRRQLTEVLSNYGDMTEIWFDGGCKIPVADILERYAPHAVVFGGHEPSPLVRWVGNEDGYAPYPNWYTKRRDTPIEGAIYADPKGDLYAPMEVDVPMLKNGGHKWFWSPKTDSLLMSVPQFMDKYYSSVGRGAVLLLNCTPDTTGLVPESHVERYKAFGAELKRRFGQPLATSQGETIKFNAPTRINHVVIQEDITHGQRVREYTIEGKTEGEAEGEAEGETNGKWTKIGGGSSIGQKRIERIAPVTVSEVRVVVDKAAAEPRLRSLSVYMIDQLPEQSADGTSSGETIAIAPWDYTTQPKTYTYDLTPYVTQIGIYEVSFRRIAGNSKLTITDPVLTMYGAQQPDMIRREKGSNTLFITRSQQTLDEFPTKLTLTIKRDESQGAGDVTIKRLTFK